MDGTDEDLYINVFTLRNFPHINEVAIQFEATYQMSLSSVVISEFAKDMGNALATIRVSI